MAIGKIYDIQEFSVHDGPGIRTTVFLKGCPLRCPWCHSPESQSFSAQIGYSAAKCIGTELCGQCIAACPTGAAFASETSDQSGLIKAAWDRAKCIQCARCASACYPGGFALIGKDWTTDDVVKKLRGSYDFFRNSGGGVTISGGEPLCQLEFTRELLMKIKADGVSTALDTTGYAKWPDIESVLPYVDLFLLDLKHMDNEKHLNTVKVPNELILENAKKIAQMGGKFQIRIPTIPGFNDSFENMHATAEFCLSLGSAVELVQLLPYHHYGASKYERIQAYDPMPADIQPPSDEKMQEYLAVFTSYGLNTIIH